MRKIIVRKTGGPEVMELVELEDPRPGPTEVVVRAHAIGVGWADVLMRSGRYPWMWPLPITLGVEMAGRIEAVGTDVKEWQAGDPAYITSRELGFRGGCYADKMCVPAAALLKVPSHVDLDHVAGLGYYALAHALLFNFIKPNRPRRVLIIGAAGGVGTALVQVARAAGAEVIGTVRSPEKGEFTRRAGANHVINTRESGLGPAVRELTQGKGVDLVVDPIVGPDFIQNLDVIAPWGHIVVYNHSGGAPGADFFAQCWARAEKAASLHFFSMHVYENDRPGRQAIARAALDMLASGSVQPPPGRFFPMTEAVAAHRLLERGESLGRIFLKP